jgi:TolA-binding protein
LGGRTPAGLQNKNAKGGIEKVQEQQRIRMKALLPILLAQVLSVTFLIPEEFAHSAEPPLASESTDRRVDQVAASTQALAISRLELMVKRYANTEQEPQLRYQLAETYQQNAAIHSRIAYGKANLKGTPVDLSDYRTKLDHATKNWTLFIDKFPQNPDIAKAYYFRGKAYEDGEKKPQAKTDYLTLTRKFPSTDEAVSAWMSLAEFAIADNAHEEAIQYLEQIEKRPKMPQYGYALYKLAWSHYNLKHTATALRYGESHIAWVRSKLKRNTTSDSTDYTLMETTLMDLALFYFQGIEEKDPDSTVSRALAYLIKQGTPTGSHTAKMGMPLGKMLLRFGKLLRSRELAEELTEFRRLAFKKVPELPESVDLLLVEFDYLQNRARFAQMPELIRELVALRRRVPTLNYSKAEKQIAQTAEGLQALVLKNKSSTDVRILLSALTSLYEEWIQLVQQGTKAGEPLDPRISLAHHNLAETQFAIGDYEGAVKNYRWIVDQPRNQSAVTHAPGNSTQGAKQASLWSPEVAGAALRALSAQSQILRKAGLFPESLRAQRSLTSPQLKPLEVDLKLYRSWITEYRVHTQGTPSLVTLIPFEFELARVLYSRGYYPDALTLLSRLVEEFPGHENAPAAAGLILDDRLALNDWEGARQISIQYLKQPNYQALTQSSTRQAFKAQVLTVASESTFKLIESFFQAKKAFEATQLAEEFTRSYPESNRFAEVQLIFGFTLETLERQNEARSAWSKLIDSPLKGGGRNAIPGITPQIQATALIARARLSESQFDLESAETDWGNYLKLASTLGTTLPQAPKPREVSAKLILLSWLNGRPAARCPKAQEAMPGELDSASLELCDSLKALAALKSYSDPEGALLDEAIERMRKSKTSAKAIYAMLALNSSSKENPLDYRDRLEAFKVMIKAVPQLDRLVLATLTPWVQREYPGWLRRARELMGKVTPISANPKSIERRVAGIQELEATLTRLAKLPWAEVRVATLIESAECYTSLVKDLLRVPAPAEVSANPTTLASYQDSLRRLTLPFEEKAQEIRSVAFKIGSEAGVSEERWQPFVTDYFAQNPSQAKELRTRFKVIKADTLIDLGRLYQIEPAFRWEESDSSMPKSKKAAPQGTPQLTAQAAPPAPSNTSNQAWGLAFQKAIESDLTPLSTSRAAALLQIASERRILSPGALAFARALFWQKAGAPAEGLGELRDARFSMTPSLRAYANWILFQNALRTSAPDLAVQYLKSFDPKKGSSAKSSAQGS